LTGGVPFFVHDLGERELAEIRDVLKGRILTTGDYVYRFESEFAAYVGRRKAVALNSCTGAIHLSLLALGVGPGDEVITTPLTFIASSTAIVEAGAKPVFVDVEPDTGNLDANRVKAAITKRTKAILPVHLYGLMCDMKALRAIAGEHGLHIVEDSAHCIEGKRDEMGPGELGDTACFSFFATKNMTCGEGGAIATDNERIAADIRALANHGMTKTSNDRFREGYQHWDMPEFGWKYNLSNIQAAMLLPQFERLEPNLRKRDALAQRYTERLAGIAGVKVMGTRKGARHARHLFPLRIITKDRDVVLERLKAAGVETVVNYRAIHLLTFFTRLLGHTPGDFPIAEGLGGQVISLPFYPNMPMEHVDRVCDLLHGIMES
jgi:UDP-4-amino-4-deoxy-L-arabinose-oxoglutarate aminotransferase